ncbi:hypothetical protein [Sinorhizobium sp. BG8]
MSDNRQRQASFLKLYKDRLGNFSMLTALVLPVLLGPAASRST